MRSCAQHIRAQCRQSSGMKGGRQLQLVAITLLCLGIVNAEDVCDQLGVIGSDTKVFMNATFQFSSSTSWEIFSVAASLKDVDLQELSYSMLHSICTAAWAFGSNCQALFVDFTSLPAVTGLVAMPATAACVSTEFMETDPSFLQRLQAEYSSQLAGLGVLPLVSVSGKLSLQEDVQMLSNQDSVGLVSLSEMDTGANNEELLGYQVALWVTVGVVLCCALAIVILCKRGNVQLRRRPDRTPTSAVDSARSYVRGSMDSCDASVNAKLFEDIKDIIAVDFTDSDQIGQQFCLAGDDLMKLNADLPDAPSLQAMSQQHSSIAASTSIFKSSDSRYTESLPTVMENGGTEQAVATDPEKGQDAPPAPADFMPSNLVPHGFLGNFLRRSHTTPENRPHGVLPPNVLDPQADNAPGLTNRRQEIMKLISRLKVDFNTLLFQKEIGRGSSKTVFLGRWGSTAVAIVRMKKGGMVTEARIMQKLGTHPNLVQFYRWARDHHGNEYMIIELVMNGSLDKLLTKSQLSLHDKLKICEQICDAMCELAREGLLHCDLAARNVLVAGTNPIHVKVADFGMSREWETPDANMDPRAKKDRLDLIPLRWASPEVIREEKWSEKSDVWAFGVTMWEVFTNGEEPFVRDLGEASNSKIVQHVLDGGHLKKPADCPDDVYTLLEDCWESNPAVRPAFENVRQRLQSIRSKLQGGPNNAVSLNTELSGPALISSMLSAHGSLFPMLSQSAPHGFMEPGPGSSHMPASVSMYNPHGMIAMTSLPGSNVEEARVVPSASTADGDQSFAGPSQADTSTASQYESIANLINTSQSHAPPQADTSTASQYESIANLVNASQSHAPPDTDISRQVQDQYVHITDMVDQNTPSSPAS